ncbi:Asp-tRNA(Asn)/Glu-tRNA(Gln) amidotransferase subunit GatA [Haloimpatiens sp. FM7330]|uniref:Asp-tRNA(Asn)/Glu-tRNA(Gln) amidotransferase subunit GatA n=1 Tax=Haloimpatiens sp. FM7330 TaxID=3298610 RepID=UPI003638A6CA
MQIHKLTAHEIRDMINKKEIKAEEVAKAYLDRIKNVDEKLGALLYVAKEEALNNARLIDKKIAEGENAGELAGIPVAVKDNINVTGMQNTCASKILQGYTSPYDAHVTKQLKKDGAVIIGKANMDEFAMGSSNENSAFKLARNPWDIDRVPGGSSGGSAVAVAAGEAPLALGTETGGSVRQPASLCGVVGLKPTYGRVSRNGVVAFGSTLDQVGTMGKDVEDCAILTKCIAGLDSGDFTTADVEVPNYNKFLTKDIKGKRIAIPNEFFGEGLDSEVRARIEESIQVLKQNGAVVEEISLPLAEYALADYYIIACAEASSNLARFDGIRYGRRAKEFKDSVDIYFKSRSEGFGEEVKRRIILGTYVLSTGYYDAYYKKALKVRNLIKQDFERVFKQYDVVVSPTSPTTAFKIGEKKEDVLSMYLSDIYTVPVNIAGLPAISVPCGMAKGLPVGLQIIGNYFEEGKLFNLAYSYEQSTNWHKNMPNV